MNKFYVFFLTIILAGCSTYQIKPYDKNGFKIDTTDTTQYSVALKTGLIKSGHSSWIPTIDFSKGKLPIYYCAHDRIHNNWMFELNNQLELVGHLESVLKSNNLLNKQSTNIIELFFKRVEQGPGANPVYTFDITVSLIKNGKIIGHRDIQLKANHMSEEGWTFDGWGGAKKRAKNRLIDKITLALNNLITEYSNNANKSI